MYHTHGDTPIYWELFFSHFKNKGPNNVYIIETETIKDTNLLESFYHQLLQPEFERILQIFRNSNSRQNPRGKIKHGTIEDGFFIDCDGSKFEIRYAFSCKS